VTARGARSVGRRVGALVGLALLGTGCANQAMPPGGPPDDAPPLVLSITPRDSSVGKVPGAVVVQFDEVVSETPRGARDLRDLVFISPRSGIPRVKWERRRLEIRPGTDWRPNTVYAVVIKPGIQDLRNNGLDTTIRLVFSTGGPIPDTEVAGVAFDWVAGKGAPNTVVEAIGPVVGKDSTIYQVAADSSGRYALRHLPPGPYLLRAFVDRNGSRTIDPLEAWDSASVTVAARAQADFYAFPHDTVGVRIATVAVEDSNRAIRVTFDKPFVPEQRFPLEAVRVLRPDSSRVGVRLVQTKLEKLRADSLATKAKADSAAAKAAADSTPAQRARADSVGRVLRADSVAAAERAAREAERREARRTGRPPRRVDTLPAPTMQRPALTTEVVVTLETPLAPQTQYRVEMADVRSLSGTVRSPSRTVTTPRAPRDSAARRDTAAARRDTAAARPDTAPARRDTATARRAAPPPGDSAARRDSTPRPGALPRLVPTPRRDTLATRRRDTLTVRRRP
jgi:hypothetical protein